MLNFLLQDASQAQGIRLFYPCNRTYGDRGSKRQGTTMNARMRTGLALAAAGLVIAAAGATAEAKIKCKGSDQIIPGHGALSTPYCQDNYLAEVAREYGANVPAQVIRQNPNEKERLCRFIGHDIRVKSTCAQYIDRGGSRN